jgi:glycosyltransferase involved in cell wall biosynthesis
MVHVNAIPDRDGTMGALNKTTVGREEHIQLLTEKIRERDQRIAQQKQQIEQLNEKLDRLEQSLEEKGVEFDDLRSRFNNIGRQWHAAATRLHHIEASTFWRTTKLLQYVWRFVENRVLGRNFMFDLVPNKDLEFQSGDLEWRAIGPDPHFHMMPVGGAYPSGWVLISSRLHRRAGDYKLKLYYDAGRGMSEATVVSLPVTESGLVYELVWLPRRVKQLRWDPMQSIGELSQGKIVISKAGPLKRSLHRISRVWEVTPRHDAAKRRETWRGLLTQPQRTYEAASSLRNHLPETEYTAWIAFHALTDSDRSAIRRHINRLRARPLMSIVMPVYNTPPDLLRAAIESVRAQLYENWELCIADDASTAAHVREILEEYRQQDRRIKVEYRSRNGHISAASNTALAVAKGEFIALFDHDDLLSEQALYQIVAELNRYADTDIVYSDEDKIDGNGRHHDPYFKPEWNPDLLYSQNYISHLGVYRTSLVRVVGGFRQGYEGSQDYDLLLRCVAARKALRIRHVPAVLYHWRTMVGSTSVTPDNKLYATQSGIKALEDHFRSCGVEGVSVEQARNAAMYRVRYPIPDPPPKVSLIIPTRDGCDLLRTCVSSIIDKTTYPNYEIVVVDNQSSDEETLRYFDEMQMAGVRVLHYDKPFNYSAINNFAVEQVDADIVGLVNNDIEVISPEWLTEMVSHAVRPEVGAVGAKLCYPNDTIQHAGVIVGLGGVAGHSHWLRRRDEPGYFGRMILVHNVSAVTGACLLVRREVYRKIGGLDATNLAVAFNDVDFCLRLAETGLRNVWTPHAELYHHESVSRGADNTAEKNERFNKEMYYMMDRWKDWIRRDPCYSPLLGLSLNPNTAFQLDFSAAPPKPWLESEPQRPQR